MTNNKTNNFAGFKFENSYSKLPDNFYTHTPPTEVTLPTLIKLNLPLAEKLGLNIEELQSAKGAEFFAGNYIAPGSKPLALAYAGHQFANFVPQLGDGRAVLLGEINDKNGQHFDIQLKGSGPTPFSRNGDGRAALGPVIREYIVSEAMQALGIKTTRSLAIVTTGQPVFRQTALPGAIITRIAPSHIRIGTFEYFASREDLYSLKTLSDYTINRHYPHCKNYENPYLQLFKETIKAQARLIASWMHIGFIHGVMNTDNCLISGHTIDYGPCAFMDEYNPGQVFSSIDRNGRYAYANQPYIAMWNLARFAQALLPLFGPDIEKSVALAEEIIGQFPQEYETYWLSGMRQKIGLFTADKTDAALVNELLEIMHKNNADFTNFFRNLGAGNNADLPIKDPAFNAWQTKWQQRLSFEDKPLQAHVKLIKSVNPARIPRNHLVEAVIRAAVDNNDFAPLDKILEALKNPYKDQPKFKKYTLPPKPEEKIGKTFCGT